MDEPLLGAQNYLAAVGVQARVRPNVIVLFDESGLPSRSPASRLRGRLARSATSSGHPFRTLEGLSDEVDLIVASPGSAVMGVTVELLAAMGARRIVTVGAAAAIAPLAGNDVCVAARAESDGPGLDYPSTCDHGDPELTARLAATLSARPVTVVSTDVPFRQSPDRLATHEADVLDMEIAALFRVADVVGVDAAAVVIVSDHYTANDWRPGDPGSFADTLRTAVAGVHGLLEGIR